MSELFESSPLVIDQYRKAMRFQAACAALTGLISTNGDYSTEYICESAICIADTLLDAFEKGGAK